MQQELLNIGQEEAEEEVQLEAAKMLDPNNEFIQPQDEKENNSYYLYSVNLTFKH